MFLNMELLANGGLNDYLVELNDRAEKHLERYKKPAFR